jgi:hypothetical protein
MAAFRGRPWSASALWPSSTRPGTRLSGKRPPLQRPIIGTKLIREYQGVEHCVTVRADDFEYLGRPYKSLSSIAREITGTKWNGLVFFGLKRHRSRT